MSRGRWSCALLILVLAASANCLFGQAVYVLNTASNSISAYTVNAGSGALTQVPGSPFTLVAPFVTGLAGIAVDPGGKFLYVTSGLDLFAYTINPGNGALIAVPGSPYPYTFGVGGGGVAVDPTGKFAYVVNQNSFGLGVFTVNPTSGALAAVAGSPFATDTSPSALAVDPTGKFVYITNTMSATVVAYAINPGSGALTAVKGGSAAAGPSPSAMALDPKSRFVYVISGNNILAYTVNAGTGALTAASTLAVQNPQGIAVDPTGKFVYVTKDFPDAVLAYTINSSTGALTAVSGPAVATGVDPTPGIVVDPSGKFVYVTNSVVFGLFNSNAESGSNNVSVYAINAGSGALTQVPGSPFATGTIPTAIAVRSQPVVPTAVVPTISSIVPASATAGGPALTVSVTGTGFLSGVAAQWNGASLVTTFTSATQLSATVPASLIATAGSASITVINSGGTASNAVSFTINPVGVSISASGVANAASRAGGAVSAGEIVTLSGVAFGPAAFTATQLDGNGYVTTTLAATQALFDGVPAPLLFAQAGQVTAVVPYEVAGNPSTQLQISYQGQISTAVAIPVAVAAPGIFTADSSGGGQGLITNDDGTANAPGNPASVGSTVLVNATGEGQTSPAGADGKPGDSPAPVPLQVVTATIGGLDAPVLAAGGVSGMTAGFFQVSVQIPPDVAVGDTVPIVLTVGGIASQANVTLAVQ